MMTVSEDRLFNKCAYETDLEFQYQRTDLSFLKDKSILITGANGLICSYLIDLLIYANNCHDLNIKIYALSRNEEKLKKRFANYLADPNFFLVIQDVCKKIKLNHVDFIIHGASNANPRLYLNDPVGTMNANYLGVLNTLELSKTTGARLLFISSGDVYGETEGENIQENNYGYIDFLSIRSSYASSKRAAETLCCAYAGQYEVHASIVRPAHIYGPTFTDSDSRAVSEFLREALRNKQIVLRSDGSSTRSYCYVGDAVIAMLKVLESGKSGEAYNISSPSAIISLKTLATTITEMVDGKLIMDLPKTDFAKKINQNVKYINLDNQKLLRLGWKPLIGLRNGIERTLKIRQ